MEESLGYMFSDIARLMRRRFDESSRDLGVTNPQWRVLINVSRNPGINQGTLAELMEVEPITTCRMVDRLEQAGLVERRRDPNDRRAWRIFLTDAAMPLLDDLKLVGAQLQALVLQGLDDKDVARLSGLLEHIRQNLTSSGSEDDSREAHHG